MNVTVRFSNLLYLTLFCAALLLFGCAIGARWGHSATTGYALICAIIAMLIHDVAMTVAAGIGAYRVAIYIRNKEKSQ